MHALVVGAEDNQATDTGRAHVAEFLSCVATRYPSPASSLVTSGSSPCSNAAIVRPGRSIAALRHEPFEPQNAGVTEQVRADLALLEWCDEDAIRPAREEPS
jgi:hypothetical protein